MLTMDVIGRLYGLREIGVYNMTIRKKTPRSEIVIDTTGPDGNAFSLMSQAKHFAR